MPTCCLSVAFLLFFFNDTAPTEIYTLSLHDALPIYASARNSMIWPSRIRNSRDTASSHSQNWGPMTLYAPDRKSTRLNSSHEWISYAVFCLKKKKKELKNKVKEKDRKILISEHSNWI